MPNLGTDPEYFILDPNGKPVPAHRFFPPAAQRVTPGNIDHLPKGTAAETIMRNAMTVSAFRDGYAVEVNVPAGYCREGLIGNMQNALSLVRAKLPSGYTLTSVPTVKIDLEDFAKDAPEDVRTFGCKPSLDAYTGAIKSPPIDAMTYPYRHAGGHMHVTHQVQVINGKSSIEWVGNEEELARFVRAADIYVGLPLAFLFNTPENIARRQWYGQAGEYRRVRHPVVVPEFQAETRTYKWAFNEQWAHLGVEYRTPSPEVWNHPAVASLAFGALRWLFMNFPTMKAVDLPADEVRHAINKGEGLEGLLSKADNMFWTSEALKRVFVADTRLAADIRGMQLSHIPSNRGWQHHSGISTR